MAHTLSNKPCEQQFLQFPSTPPQKFYQRYLSHSTRLQTPHSIILWVTFHMDAASNLTLASRNPQGKLLPVRYVSQQKQKAQLAHFLLTLLNAHSTPGRMCLSIFPAKFAHKA
jgi:hypothetical protein